VAEVAVGISESGVDRRPPDLDRLFAPASIAVIGATDNPAAGARVTYTRIRDWCARHGVVLHPVSATRPTVDGAPAYQALRDVPGPIDVALVLVSDAITATRDAVDRGCRFVVVFSAGFTETGAEGARRQRELADIVRASDTYLLGPNTAPNLYEDFRADLEGKSVALVSQSGAQGRPLYQAQELGLKMSHWAPTGNEADLESADFIEYFADQPGVGVVAAYIEGFKDGGRFQRAAGRAADRHVPIVMVKAGRTELGASWATSHTGHLAGNDRVASAVCRQHGVIRVDAIDELIDTAMMLSRCTPAAGRGVCAYTTSGGTGTLFADLATSVGLEFAKLSDTTIRALRTWIPERQRVSNPIDGAAAASADMLEVMISDPAVDVLVLPLAGSFPPMTDQLADNVIEVSGRTAKPICVIWTSPLPEERALLRLQQAQVPVFRRFGNATTAIKAYLDYSEFIRSREPARAPVPDARRVGQARTLLAARTRLSEADSKRLLSLYDIPVSRDRLCTSAAQAVSAADAAGYPVVLKACGPTLTHKSDLGLVRVGVPDAQGVAEAFDDITSRSALAAPGEIDGIIVSELIAGGVETIIGVSNDETFGPVVMFGSGGVGVELYEDVTFRVPPFTVAAAVQMIGEVRAARLLGGFRGLPKIDVLPLAELIVAVGDLAYELRGALAELDVNPLIIRPDRIVAVDALAVRRSR
jgi:acyl-CoA synthetase (NDP forming)